jgi:hypothetical protein
MERKDGVEKVEREEREREREREREKKDVHSAQFGDEAMVEVICLFRALREGFDEGSSRISSWRFEGGRVKRRGRAIFLLRSCLLIGLRCNMMRFAVCDAERDGLYQRI